MKKEEAKITIEEMVQKLKSDETSQTDIVDIWDNIKKFPNKKNQIEFLVATNKNTPKEILLELANSPRQLIKFYLAKRKDLPQEVRVLLCPPRAVKKQFKGVEVSY